MIQTVAIEEACLHPDYTELSTRYTNKHTPIVDALCDIHDDRLKKMTENGNEYQVLSLTSPGPQGETDVAKVYLKYNLNLIQAEDLARVTNDWIAEQVKKNPKRFGAFASLSMHRPEQAAKELRRAVQELGLVGAILNDWQATGTDGNGILLFDTPDFDPFWEVAQELDVPIYFHPKVRFERRG
jgi:2,3-dihydroxybenzoate decarboxylase